MAPDNASMANAPVNQTARQHLHRFRRPTTNAWSTTQAINIRSAASMSVTIKEAPTYATLIRTAEESAFVAWETNAKVRQTARYLQRNNHG